MVFDMYASTADPIYELCLARDRRSCVAICAWRSAHAHVGTHKVKRQNLGGVSFRILFVA
jgi:hypothetical protein